MKEIQLTQGKFAIVPDSDYDYLSRIKWSIMNHGRTFYGRHHVGSRNATGKRDTIMIHRVIWERHNGPIPPGMEIDHINGNGLDNRLENLRICTHHQNTRNTHRDKTGCTSRFQGVVYRRNRWIAYIKDGKRQVYLGAFDTEVKAALAYNLEASKLFGEYANLNVIEGFHEISDT
jgi:hypothetical protein